MFCFTSRLVRKSDPVGRTITIILFVNVMYEYHSKTLLFYNNNESGVTCVLTQVCFTLYRCWFSIEINNIMFKQKNYQFICSTQ